LLSRQFASLLGIIDIVNFKILKAANIPFSLSTFLPLYLCELLRWEAIKALAITESAITGLTIKAMAIT
jgi:hypothetical protein